MKNTSKWELKNMKYAVEWSDGYATTFYIDYSSARQAISESGVQGTIIDMNEYLKRFE